MFVSLWVFSESLKFLVALNDICFPIHTPEIFILPKPWFTIMGLAPLYPNFPTNTIFRNPWQSIRVQSIRFPLYISNDSYLVSHRHKCPHNFPTQQGYFPIQVPKHRVISKLTQGSLNLWPHFGTTSSPLTHDSVLSLSQGGCLVKKYI